jgi:Tfp pilus assembly protein PilE
MVETSNRSGLTRTEVSVTVVVVGVLIALLVPAIQQAREIQRRTISRSNLRELAMAVENYQDAFSRFPSGGTFATDGTPLHSWTFFLQSWLAQVAPQVVVDQSLPWDDPINLMPLTHAEALWIADFLDPSMPQSTNNAGMYFVHYSPNQWLMHRNSAVQSKDVDDRSNTLLFGDGFGEFPIFGDPYNWRDPTVPYRSRSTGFGHVVRKDVTHLAFVDGHVQAVSSEVDSEITGAWAGPESLRPDPELVAYHDRPYRLPTGPGWTYAIRVRGHKMLMRLKLSPDKKPLIADFGRAHEMDRPFEHTCTAICGR